MKISLYPACETSEVLKTSEVFNGATTSPCRNVFTLPSSRKPIAGVKRHSRRSGSLSRGCFSIPAIPEMYRTDESSFLSSRKSGYTHVYVFPPLRKTIAAMKSHSRESGSLFTRLLRFSTAAEQDNK